LLRDLRVKEFLTRNGHPYSYIDLDVDAGVQDLLDAFQVGAKDVPVVICRGEVVLRNPTNVQIATASLQQRDRPDASARCRRPRSGTRGTRGRCVRASEGLDVLVIESNAPAAAGTSSKSRTISAFPPHQRSGLASRAFDQRRSSALR